MEVLGCLTRNTPLVFRAPSAQAIRATGGQTQVRPGTVGMGRDCAQKPRAVQGHSRPQHTCQERAHVPRLSQSTPRPRGACPVAWSLSVWAASGPVPAALQEVKSDISLAPQPNTGQVHDPRIFNTWTRNHLVPGSRSAGGWTPQCPPVPHTGSSGTLPHRCPRCHLTEPTLLPTLLHCPVRLHYKTQFKNKITKNFNP